MAPIPASPDVELLTKEWGMQRLMKIRRCDLGATAIEYALIASLISIAAIVGMNNLGTKIDTMFNNVSNHL
jgi:pilus assembly protein Flp/PilA